MRHASDIPELIVDLFSDLQILPLRPDDAARMPHIYALNIWTGVWFIALHTLTARLLGYAAGIGFICGFILAFAEYLVVPEVISFLTGFWWAVGGQAVFFGLAFEHLELVEPQPQGVDAKNHSGDNSLD